MSKDYEFYMAHHISEVKDMTSEDQAKYKRGQAQFDRMQEKRNRCYYCENNALVDFAGVRICGICCPKLFQLPKDKK